MYVKLTTFLHLELTLNISGVVLILQLYALLVLVWTETTLLLPPTYAIVVSQDNSASLIFNFCWKSLNSVNLNIINFLPFTTPSYFSFRQIISSVIFK